MSHEADVCPVSPTAEDVLRAGGPDQPLFEQHRALRREIDRMLSHFMVSELRLVVALMRYAAFIDPSILPRAAAFLGVKAGDE